MTYAFPVTISPPAGAAAGVYNIPLTAFTDGGPSARVLGSAVIQVRLGWQYFPWKTPMMIVLALLTLLAMVGVAIRDRRYGTWLLEYSGEATWALVQQSRESAPAAAGSPRPW